MKNIIAVVLVLSLLVFSASAADVYDIEDDTSVLSSPVSVLSTDSGVATAEFTGEDSNYLRLIYDNLLNLTTHVSNRFDIYLSDLDYSLYHIFSELTSVNSSFSSLLTSVATESTLSSLLLSVKHMYNFVASESGHSFLASNGSISETVTQTGVSDLVRVGIMGLAVKLDSILTDTGNLAYMFASPEDIEAKQKSSSVSKAAADSFYSSDAEGASVSLNTVSSLKDISDGAGDLFDTGYGVTDLFTEIDSNSDFLSWFTVETAQALDTTSQVMSVGDEDPYNMNIYYEQFNAIAVKRGEDVDG